jgi:hypothetical protein
MKKGKEPMRTFGDLMQFFEVATDDKKPSRPDRKGQAFADHDHEYVVPDMVPAANPAGRRGPSLGPSWNSPSATRPGRVVRQGERK